MAQLVTERITSRPGSQDVLTAVRTRVFDVQLPPDSATGPAATGNSPTPLPKIESEYPVTIPVPGGEPLKLFCDRYDLKDQEDGTTEVTCVYTSDRSGRLNTAPDSTKPGFISLGATYEEFSTAIPVLFAYPIKSNGSSILSQKPNIEDTVYHVPSTRVVNRCQVTTGTYPYAYTDLLKKMSGKLNFINNDYYRFKAGTISQVEKKAWILSYEWLSDPGTAPLLNLPAVQSNPNEPPYVPIGPQADNRKAYFPPNQDNKMKLLDPTIQDDNLYVRSPWHVLTYFTASDMIPIWLQYCPYAIDRLGWQQLPGSPVF